MTPSHFIDVLQSISFKDTFNPYIHRCHVHDCDDAPARRRDTLLAILDAAAAISVDAIWIGRDLGYRGGRRTGLALTDDVHMQMHAKRWGVSALRPTKGPVVAERTAAFIWSVLAQIDTPVFLWNVFPLHPHEASDPFSNRCHNASERRVGEDVLVALLELLEPRRLVAIGNDAAQVARRLCHYAEVIQVRHPSYGGQTKFRDSICELYNLPC